MFSTNLTSALEKECGNAAEGACKLLRMMNDYVVQPLLTTSPQKGFKTKESMVFSSVNDIRLKCFNEIAYWLQNDWYALIKSFPINNHAGVIDKSVPKVNNRHAADNANSDYYETIQFFLEPDENVNDISEPSTEASNKVKETRGRKKLIGGPSEETFLTLSHTLCAHSDLNKNLLSKKGLKHVLTGRSNNDPI